MPSRKSGLRQRYGNVLWSTPKEVSGVQHRERDNEISGQNHFLELLFAHVAPNAVLNAGGRADNVRCYPGSREEVIGIIETWISGGGDLSRDIFWLSGPAGAGKTAIIQTVAERCTERNIPMANYFFFRTDSTRNHAGSLVATLLYQIRRLYPGLDTNIATLLTTNPLIFDQSIRDQLRFLIDIPMRTVVDDSARTNRLVLLIDGLDECSPETKHVQGDLLRALHHLSSQQDSPFLVLVASRAESHLVMAFNEIGSSSNSIFLDDNYRPFADIRRFVTAEFDQIKRNHYLSHTLEGNWPSEASINEIVKKSSGQFIYVATVMRFISDSPASPARSLDIVCGIRPIAKNSPFAELDAIYTFIISQAEDRDSVKDILAAQILLPSVQESNSTIGLGHKITIYTLLAPLGFNHADIELHLCDLHSVVNYSGIDSEVQFYHASLLDFLLDKSRSKVLYIDLNMSAANLATAHILAMSSLSDVELFCTIFSLVKTVTPALRAALISWEPHQPSLYHHDTDQWRMQRVGHRFAFSLQKLFAKDDKVIYKDTLPKWLKWFFNL